VGCALTPPGSEGLYFTLAKTEGAGRQVLCEPDLDQGPGRLAHRHASPGMIIHGDYVWLRNLEDVRAGAIPTQDHRSRNVSRPLALGGPIVALSDRSRHHCRTGMLTLIGVRSPASPYYRPRRTGPGRACLQPPAWSAATLWPLIALGDPLFSRRRIYTLSLALDNRAWRR